MELVFATGNKNKVKEVNELIGTQILLLSLSDIGCDVDIPETAPTLEGNARQKAEYVFNHYGKACFADDTGLEIKALNGHPGVLSARYAGLEKDPRANMQKVLTQMQGFTNREACFRTVIVLLTPTVNLSFEGVLEGTILNEQRGKEGFGYDPIFLPKGYSQTLAEMDLKEKNKISHRALAVNKLVAYLKGRIQH
jgi:XTP/dITP diphosphohydrolase